MNCYVVIAKNFTPLDISNADFTSNFSLLVSMCDYEPLQTFYLCYYKHPSKYYKSDDDRIMLCIGVFSTLEKAKEVILEHNITTGTIKQYANYYNYYVYNCKIDEIMNLEYHETCFTYY